MIEPQNPTDPERDPDESGPHVEPRVQIVRDPGQLSEQVREALLPAFSTTEPMRDALLPSLTAIEHLREIFKPIELPKIELPEIDSRAFVPPAVPQAQVRLSNAASAGRSRSHR